MLKSHCPIVMIASLAYSSLLHLVLSTPITKAINAKLCCHIYCLYSISRPCNTSLSMRCLSYISLQTLIHYH
ncbi:hypothetical protein V8B55DRAFT_1529727 [Mucor lusitanicus]